MAKEFFDIGHAGREEEAVYNVKIYRVSESSFGKKLTRRRKLFGNLIRQKIDFSKMSINLVPSIGHEPKKNVKILFISKSKET